MHRLLQQLQGGDRRSIGKSEQAVAEVLRDPALIVILIDALHSDDPVLAMRAADALEKISLSHADYCQSHKDKLLEIAGQTSYQEVRWHLAQILPRLQLEAQDRQRLITILQGYLDDNSSIVRTCALQALVDVTMDDDQSRTWIRQLVQESSQGGTAAMQARARKILAQWAKPTSKA